MVTLKDGTEVEDARLDRIPQFDEESREYPIRTAIPSALRQVPRTRRWRKGQRFVIDQGREGACVGYAVTNELNCRPAIVRYRDLEHADTYAREVIYWGAQRIDPWPGGAYPGAKPRYDGTSVLAGVKVAQQRGHFQEYRWSFGIDDLVIGLSHAGPAVLGLAWFQSNYTPDDQHMIRPGGVQVGGHAILARGVQIVAKPGRRVETMDDVDRKRSRIILLNSWGGDWGLRGECFVTLADMADWLDADGEAVFFMQRRHGRAQ
jgi:hypothetical protein